LVGLDQGQVDEGIPYSDGQAREAGARPYIDHLDFGWNFFRRVLFWRREQMPCGEEGLAKMAGNDFLRLADRGEVDARVPAQ